MAAERQIRAPPGKAAQAAALPAAAARHGVAFSPAGLQRRFGNQGAQAILHKVVTGGAAAAPARSAAPLPTVSAERQPDRSPASETAPTATAAVPAAGPKAVEPAAAAIGGPALTATPPAGAADLAAP